MGKKSVHDILRVRHPSQQNMQLLDDVPTDYTHRMGEEICNVQNTCLGFFFNIN